MTGAAMPGLVRVRGTGRPVQTEKCDENGMAIASLNPLTLVKRHFHSLASLVIRGTSVAAGFGIALLIGRMFGPEANGHYALITQTGMFLSVVAVGGLDLAVTREFSAATARNIRIASRSFFRVVGYSMLIACGIVLLLAMIGPQFLTRLFNGDVPQDALIVLVLIMLSRALTRMLGAVLRSQKAYSWGQAVEVLLIPTTVLVLVGLSFARSVEQVLWMTALVGMTVGITAFFTCLRHISRSDDALDVPMRRVLKVALPLWGVAIFLNIADWYGLATVSQILGIYSAGLYRVAVQIASVLGIITMGLFSIFSPQFAAAYAAKDMPRVARLAGSATRLSTIFSFPIAVLLFLFARPALGLFGPEFVEAETVLRIVVVGQAMFTITGPAGLLLAMTGHERINLMVTLVSTGALLVVAPVAAHLAGLYGISACMALVMIGRNLASLYFVYRLNGINVLTGSFKPRPEPAADMPPS